MKNPVYPYYNSLFHSPYFGETDFKDPRWGPSNIKEFLLWAYSMIRHPDYRLSEIPAKYNLDLALMYLGAAGAGLCWIWKRVSSRTGTLFLLYAASFILWAATTGHSRYFMGGILFAGMLCGCLVLQGMASISPRLTGGVVFAIMFIVVYAGRAYDAYTCVWNGRGMGDAGGEP